VIRRGFWLMTGAVTGIYGYRRVAAVGRRVSATLTPGAGLGPANRQSGRRPRANTLSAGRLARETFRFARDVREGMELYMTRHDAPAGSTLTTDHEAQPEDGR
jgi:hypothetical protein